MQCDDQMREGIQKYLLLCSRHLNSGLLQITAGI